ncbi:MAG: PD-(D/E)XK nuclease family protein [Candidatus Poseidoniaceae archaeon]
MPVTDVVLEDDSVGPYDRLSSSQVNTYRSCKRMWFYEKVLKLKILQIPVLYVGRAVEEAICRTLKESPSLMLKTASELTLSTIPIDENGKPSRDSSAKWPANRIIPLPIEKRPSSIDELENWALARLEIHLPTALENARKDWARQERKSGDWSEVKYDYCLEMCLNGIRFHLNEVNICFNTINDATLADWRQGKRDHWPAPDGYGYHLVGKHSLSVTGPVTIAEAWEIARPWFVEPESENFSMNAIHPEYWFQGEYDIVYRWDGNIKIVDIKASKGIGDRSGDYVEQLRMYAMLWWTTHNKQETIDDLEIWYLGANVKKSVITPSIDEMSTMESELNQLYLDIKFQTPSIEKCPASPMALRGFSEGGIPTTAPVDMIRCDRCDWQSICEGGSGDEYSLGENEFNVPGLVSQINTVDIKDLNVRFNLEVVVDSINYPEEKPPEMKVSQANNRARVDFLVSKNQEGKRTYPQSLNKGQKIFLKNVILTSNFKGELTIKVDPLAEVLVSGEGLEFQSLLEFRARWNIAGMLAYKYERRGIGRTGREWHRKGMVILNENNSIKVSGWANDWGHQYDMAEEGSYVLLSNIELDAWANQIKGQIGRNSRAHLLR